MPGVRPGQETPSAQLGSLLLRGYTMLAEACPDCHVSTAEASECCTTTQKQYCTVLRGCWRLTTSFIDMQVPLMRDPATMQSQCVGCHHFYSPAEVQVG